MTEAATNPLRVVLDTDAFNEVDDQFTLAYACLSPERIRLEACYAAPFSNTRSSNPADGMEKSYHEILRVLDLLDTDLGGNVYRGALDYVQSTGKPVESAAVGDLISRAMDETRHAPLYVVGIAAATNLASAIMIEPRIIPRIRVIWLGGHPLYWKTADEFNLRQDVRAAQVLLDCGVDFTLVPCKNVAEHLRTTVPELDSALPGESHLCRFLVERFKLYITEKQMLSKPLWDVAALAQLVNPAWVSLMSVPSPVLTDDKKWLCGEKRRHTIKIADELKRDAIFGDLFRKLAAF